MTVNESRSWIFDGRVFIGLLIIALGVIFLLGNIYPEFNFWRFIGKLWPVVIIILGIYLILNQGNFGKQGRQGFSSTHSRVVGDVHLAYNGQELGNINASQVIGDMTIDLSGGRLKPGINQITSSLVIGDLSVLIPSSFPLKVNAKTVIGDIKFDQKRESGLTPKLEHTDSNYEQSISKLLLNLSGTIGDITIQRL